MGGQLSSAPPLTSPTFAPCLQVLDGPPREASHGTQGSQRPPPLGAPLPGDWADPAMHLVQPVRTVLTSAPPLPRILSPHGARHVCAHLRLRGALATLDSRTLDASPTLRGSRRTHPRAAAERRSPPCLPAHLALSYNSSSPARQQGTATGPLSEPRGRFGRPASWLESPSVPANPPAGRSGPLSVLALPHTRDYFDLTRVSFHRHLTGTSQAWPGAARSHTRASRPAPLTGAPVGRAEATWRAPLDLFPSPRGRHFDVHCSRGWGIDFVWTWGPPPGACALLPCLTLLLPALHCSTLLCSAPLSAFVTAMA